LNHPKRPDKLADRDRFCRLARQTVLTLETGRVHQKATEDRRPGNRHRAIAHWAALPRSGFWAEIVPARRRRSEVRLIRHRDVIVE